MEGGVYIVALNEESKDSIVAVMSLIVKSGGRGVYEILIKGSFNVGI